MAQGLVAMAFCVGWEKILKSFFFSLRKESDEQPWSFFALNSAFLSSPDATQAVCQLSGEMTFLHQADPSKFGANRKHDFANRRLRFN